MVPAVAPHEALKLNIGCGRALKAGFVNCDLSPGEGVDYAFDCQKRWPFPDESVSRIETDHTVEHLTDPMGFFREAWRVLIPMGQLQVRVPYGWHQSSWWDLTHVRPWLQESFAILQPGFTYYTRNYQHDRMGFAFWVATCTLIFERPFARMWRFWPLRPLVRSAGRHLLNVYRDVQLEAWKTTETDVRSTAFGGKTHPASVPVSFGALEHEYYGKKPDNPDYHKLLIFHGGESPAGCE